MSISSTSTLDRSSYLAEIQAMMYAMGDCRRPLAETAKIFEQTLLKQLRQHVNKAVLIRQEYFKPLENPEGKKRRKMDKESGDCVKGEHVLMALKDDSTILRRLVHRLKMADLKNVLRFSTEVETTMVNVASSTIDEHNPDSDEDEVIEGSVNIASLSMPLGKRGRYCARVLKDMDASGALFRWCMGVNENGTATDEATALTDDAVLRERQMRLAAKAAAMDTGEYMRYAEARQVSFLPGGPGGKGNNRASSRRFANWILGNTSTSDDTEKANEMKFSDQALELLNLLARELLSILIDCTFFVKRECSSLRFPTAGQDVYRLRPQVATLPPVRPAVPNPTQRKSSDMVLDANFDSDPTAPIKPTTLGSISNQPSAFAGYGTTTASTTSSSATNAAPQQSSANLAETLLLRARSLNEVATLARQTTNNTAQAMRLENRVALQPSEAREAVRRLLFYAKHRDIKRAMLLMVQ